MRVGLILLAAVSAYAQMGAIMPAQRAKPAAAPPANPEDRGSIEGTILNSATGEPVRKAQVTAVSMDRGGARESAGTDSSGKFKFSDIDPGRWRLTASRNGFAEARGGGQQVAATVTVGTKQNVTGIVLKLAPAAIISGRVLDEDGEPLLHVQVQALRITYGRSGRRLAPADNASTDDLGQYRLFGLGVGNYFVRATYPNAIINNRARRASGAAADEGYAPQFYPGTIDATQAIVIPVRAGDEQRGVDFRFSLTRMVRVRGRVIGAAGTRMRGTMIGLSSRREGAPDSGQFTGADDNGAFDIRGVVPGSYDLVAFQGGRDGALSAWRQIEVGEADADGVELVLRAGSDIKGRVRVEAAGNTTPPSVQNMRVALTVDGPRVPFAPPTPSVVDEDGSFLLKGAGEGAFTLELMPLPPDCYIKSIKAGGAETADGRLTVGPSGTGPIEVVLSATGGRIEGTTMNEGQPVPDVTVVLVPDAERRDRYSLYREVRANADGRFAMAGIAPGNYTLFAWESIESGAYRDPAVLEKYRNEGKPIRVEESSRQSSVEVAVIRTSGN